MSKTFVAQNLKLIQSIHNQIDFLKQFSTQQLTQISNKAFFFVFSSGTVIAQQKQEIDFIGIILQGKVTISGKGQKKSSGFVFGQLGYFGIVEKHAYSVIGQSDGIVMAIRFQDIPKLSKDIRSTINMYSVSQALHNLKNPNGQLISQAQQVQQRKIAHLLHQSLKSLLNQQIEPKQKQKLLKYFPYLRFTCKNQVISKFQEPYLLYVAQGQLVIKYQYQIQGQPIHKITTGQFYNVQGFLLNYSKNVNIYCLTDDAIVLKINRRLFQNLMDYSTVQRFDNFLIRKQINDRKYQVLTYQKRKEKQAEQSSDGKKGKWSMFSKTNYQILPLSIPKNMKRDAQKAKPSVSQKDQKQQQFQGIIFRQHQLQSKNIKTNSSMNSKMNKIITMKTQKNQQKVTSIQQQLKQVQKQLDMLNTKIKYYEENFIKAKLEMIQYKSKYNMNSVFKQINQLGDKRYRKQIGGDTSAKVMTLKKAFQQQMKQNKIMEVVARCAYRWLWAVRRKRGFNKMGITQ